jgi:hypothetical protein
MGSPSVIHGLWFAGLVLQAVLAGVLLVKKMWGKFPIFTAYLLFSLLDAAVAYAVFQHRSLYFYTYVVGETIFALLGLGVVYEIFTHLFSAQPALRKLAKLVFRGVVVLLVVLAGAVIYAQTPIGEKGIGVAILVGEEAARIIEVGLVMFLFLFSSVFGLHWRQSVFGIALGLGILTATELVAVTMMQHVGQTVQVYLSLAQMFAFNFSLLIWMGYLLAPERVTSAAEVPKQAQLEQWNQAIMELINQ